MGCCRRIFLYAAIALSMCPPLCALADGPLYASVGEVARTPTGWQDFCKANPSECQGGPTKPRDVTLTDAALSKLKQVNSWVNKNVVDTDDLTHWGVIEKWSIPTDGRGDSEDFALLKRKMLIDAGWPREALLMTIVRFGKGEKNGVTAFGVLTVKTDKGEFILTQESDEVLSWRDTTKNLDYRFFRRQSQSDPNIWVSLSDPK